MPRRRRFFVGAQVVIDGQPTVPVKTREIILQGGAWAALIGDPSWTRDAIASKIGVSHLTSTGN